MAVAHIQYDPNLRHGQQLRGAMLSLGSALDLVNELFAVMNQMRDGGSVTVYLQNKFGFPDVATAQAAYDEINSLQLKLNSDASVTNVHTAIIQAVSKFG